MVSDWVPDAGETIWVDLNPTVGHEQAGKRPALVLSPKSYNEKTSLLLACPMTTEIKGYPFEVLLPDGKAAILADQVKCLDWRMRNVRPKDSVPSEILQQVRDLLRGLIQI